MSDKCQVYKLNSKLSLKGSAQSVEKGPSLHLFFCSSSSSPPGFLVYPRCIPCSCFPLVLRAVCSFLFSLAFCTSHSHGLMSNCPCQFFCWCFLFCFHLTPFGRAYQGLLTAPAVRYLSTVYLSETFSRSHSGHKQPACLAGPRIL